MKLGLDIAEKGHRPPIRSNWNPGLSFLITSCWHRNPELRPNFRQVISLLSTAISASGGGRIKLGEVSKVNVHLAPGALWRRVETKPANINLGKVIGDGATSTVHEATFAKKQVAVKIFRNTTEEKAFKEIEITFSMRHPNVIGMYAWFQIKGWLYMCTLCLVSDLPALSRTNIRTHVRFISSLLQERSRRLES